jgi:membrane fusion protein (multidrug efflux system)
MIVNKESEVELKMLNLDRAMGASWLVASGLVDGDRVILQGRQFIRPGMPVRIAPAPAGDQGSAGVREAETSPKGDA